MLIIQEHKNIVIFFFFFASEQTDGGYSTRMLGSTSCKYRSPHTRARPALRSARRGRVDERIDQRCPTTGEIVLLYKSFVSI